MTKTSLDAVKIARRKDREVRSISTGTLDALEGTMQKLSLVVSSIALGLMLAGFADLLLHRPALVLPGDTALSLAALLQIQWSSFSVVTMSIGIVLLALLPAVRVVLAMVLYYRNHVVLDTVVAIIVLAELLVSTRLG